MKIVDMLWKLTEAGPEEDLVHHLCYLPPAECIQLNVEVAEQQSWRLDCALMGE